MNGKYFVVAGDFKEWHDSFVKTHNRSPTKEDIMMYEKIKIELIERLKDEDILEYARYTTRNPRKGRKVRICTGYRRRK